MSREWQIELKIAPDAPYDDADLVWYALEMAGIEFEYEGDVIFVYVDAAHSPKRAKQRILHAMRDAGIPRVLETPLRAYKWDPQRNLYVDPSLQAGAPVEPEVGEIGWMVRVRPRDVWAERDLRAHIATLGRPVIGEEQRWIEIGVVDEADAEEVAPRLGELAETSEVSTKRLRRLERWLVRERLRGNYAYGGAEGPYGTDIGNLGGGDAGG
jgi:hypothetical protein